MKRLRMKSKRWSQESVAFWRQKGKTEVFGLERGRITFIQLLLQTGTNLGLTQHQFIVSQFCRSEVSHGSDGVKDKGVSRAKSHLEALGKKIFSTYLRTAVQRSPGVLALAPCLRQVVWRPSRSHWSDSSPASLFHSFYFFGGSRFALMASHLQSRPSFTLKKPGSTWENLVHSRIPPCFKVN